MKKILQFLLIISLIFVLLGCGDKPQEKEKPDEKPVNPPEEIKEKDKSIMITFYVDEDIICIEEYINKIELIDYSEEGYSFIGWYLDSELTNPFNPDDIDNYFNLGTMNLYAKMEKLMEDFDIRITLINNESAINPSFTWENNNNSTYHITLLKGTTVVKELDTDKTYYQVDSALDTNTTYSFKVLDKVSNKEKSIEFKTLSTYENKIKTITLDNPYSDNSVIQRNVQNEITGIGPEKQVISLHIGTEEYFALSDENGEFSITLPARNASFDSVDITITNNIGVSKVIKDVLFGDVYLFA